MASRAVGGAFAPQLLFDGSEDKYDLWETRFLGHLHILKLKDIILKGPSGSNEEQQTEARKKNADCYAE